MTWRSRAASAMTWRCTSARTSSAMVAEERAELLDDLGHDDGRVDGQVHGRRILAPLRSDRGDDRVDQPIDALDLGDDRVVPLRPCRASHRVARAAAVERRLLGEQVGVGAHDGEWRAQLVRHEGDQLHPALVERAQLVDAILRLALEPDALDDAGQQVGDGARAGRGRRA